MLKGCSLYLMGLGVRKNAIGRVLARRLPRYRYYDLPELMCSTYTAMQGATETVGTKQLLHTEPLADVEELSSAILREVQQFSRSVHVVWDGAVSTANFMVMQQGIVVHLDTGVRHCSLAKILGPLLDARSPSAAMLLGVGKPRRGSPPYVRPRGGDGEVAARPCAGGRHYRYQWRYGCRRRCIQGDISAAGTCAWHARFSWCAPPQVVEDVLIFISKNPSKSKEWKERAEEALADQERGA